MYNKIKVGQIVNIQGKSFKVKDKDPSSRNYKIPRGVFAHSFILIDQKDKNEYFLGIGKRPIFLKAEPAITEDEELGNINIINKVIVDDDREIEEEKPLVDLIPFGDTPFFE